MFAHLYTAFGRLFSARRSRLAVSTLIAVTAIVPIFEILVLRLFSTLIIDGPDTIKEDRSAVIVQIGIFLLAFALTRVVHHLVRLIRVRVFRSGVQSEGESRGAYYESWGWALAFELSGVIVSLVQAFMFSLLFIYIDWPTGFVSAGASAIVLVLISIIYSRQLEAQRHYVAIGTRPGTVAIAHRVGHRIRDAEFGAILATIAMMFVMVFMLARTLAGDVDSADAIVLFLALRLLSGQLSTMSASLMRFARAAARRGEF